jgi:LysM repeat protein
LARAGWRAWLARVAAPAAFLAAVTVAVLIVRAGLETDEPRRVPPPPPPPPATTQTPTETAPAVGPTEATREYVVREGDTLDRIALEFDTTVERLLELNPRAEPTSLQPGQRLRVPARAG